MRPWLRAWRHRKRVHRRVQYVSWLAVEHLNDRMKGKPVDPKYDGVIDALLDLADELP